MQSIQTIWGKWLKIAHVIGNFQAQLIFTLFYFFILFPIGLGVRFLSDPLNIKLKKKRSNFIKWGHPAQNIEEARKQY